MSDSAYAASVNTDVNWMKAGPNSKKNKKAEKEDEDNEGKGPKRLKITYARGGGGD